MSRFKIHFSKCNIKIRFISKENLPKYKVSMLRGSIGEVLLQENCLKDNRDCKGCMFQQDCIVPRFYYHPLKITPEYVTENGNEGYLFECFDKRQRFEIGDTMDFQMLLFGEVIIYFSQILQVLYHLGVHGVGKEKLQFEIVTIKNQDGKIVFQNQNFFLRHVVPTTLEQYLEKKQEKSKRIKIQMLTPWTQKYQGKMLQKFEVDAFVDAVYRRCYLLHCFEGIEIERGHPFRNVMRIEGAESREAVVYRESSRHEKRIPLRGIIGTFELCNIPEEFVPYLYAGELVHIGKNVTMGFGKYRILK